MHPITLLDGGMGSELRRIGAPFRQPEWSALALVDDPAAVVEAHSNFIEAGAQVITANNYAVVPYHLGEAQFEQRGEELVELAGRLARRAADTAAAAGQHVRVAGSLPPIWGSYEPDLFEPALASPIYSMIVEALDPWVDIWPRRNSQHRRGAQIRHRGCASTGFREAAMGVVLSPRSMGSPHCPDSVWRGG